MIKEEYDAGFSDQFPEINPIILQLLFNRGLTKEDEIDRFLGPDYLRDQNDPFLFNELPAAMERIFAAIKRQEKIVIYGDYDADGVTATALLQLTLKRLGAKDLKIYIPNRMSEGYGMNLEAVEELYKSGSQLIITVDCGIANRKEIALAKERGMDVIVTDHHLEPIELPEAVAIICPTLKKEKYPFKKLAGVGVAFKLSQALLRSDKQQNNESFEKWLLDLVAIGTIADSMPLLEENRTLVKWGLIVLNKTQRLGLKELTQLAQSKEIDVHGVAFQLAPRLNAAGRMDHANTAYDLLITEDEAEALAISNDLNQKNQARQRATEEMLQLSLTQIGMPTDEDKILFSSYDGWSPGLVGLVAGKLSDKFNRPVIVFGKSGEEYVASGRSIPEFDITAALGECKKYLSEFGGHEQACGLTIVGEKNYEIFKDKIKEIASNQLAQVELAPRLEIEAEIKLKDAGWEIIDGLDKFSPFGEGNREPLFLTRDLTVVEIATMGTMGQHLKLILEDKAAGLSHKFVGFGVAGEWVEKIKAGDKVEVVYELGVNEWNGNREVQFKIVDLQLYANSDANKYEKHTNSDANKYEYHANRVDACLVNEAGKEDESDEEMNILHKELCFRINGVLYEVQNRLGRTSNERQYCELAELLFSQAQFKFEREKEIPFEFKEGKILGNKVDFYLEDLVLVDFKAKKNITKDDYFQMQRYLQASKLKLGMIVNFKKYPLEIKRVINKNGNR